MINIGNDIISLKSVNKTRTRDEKFYSKILAPSEVELYNHSKYENLDFEDFVWMLWSVKEAVYKCHQRNDTSLVFSPTKIIVSHLELPQKQPVSSFTVSRYESADIDERNSYNCIVHFKDTTFYGRSILYQELIYTLVTNHSSFASINWGIAVIENSDYESQHNGVRFFVLDRLGILFPEDNLRIMKSDFGFPVVIKNEAETMIPISFTHHKQYIGYAFLVPEYYIPQNCIIS